MRAFLARLQLVALTFAMLSGGAPAAAAPAPATAPDDVLVRLLPERGVRIETLDGRDVEGRYVRHTADSLWLARADGMFSAPLAETHRLWVRGRSPGAGLLVGAVVGGLAVAAVGGGDSPEGESGGGVIAFTMGAVAGGFVGSLIGLAIPGWKLRYDAPGVEPAPPVSPPPGAAPTGRPEPPWIAGAVVGGRTLDDDGPIVSGRVLYATSPQFAIGGEYVHFRKEESWETAYGTGGWANESTTSTGGLSLLARYRLGGHTVRPVAVAGVSILRDKLTSVQSTYDPSGNLVAQWESRESNGIVGFFVGPGLSIGGGGLHVDVEGRWEVLAGRGYYDDIFAVMAGIGYR